MKTNSAESCKYREAPPKAGAMIEALRGIGYNTATALADIIDNSIAAGASNIDLNFHWDSIDSRIEILDDGKGMNPNELDLAMRLGEKNPLEIRTEGDLGRFGLGLKTASFSQCKRLTVASKKNDALSILHWDLDVIANDKEDRWILLEGAPQTLNNLCKERLSKLSAGTYVCWEVLDRIITTKFNTQDFMDLIDVVESHISMVFHRFLDGTYGKIKIKINGTAVKPWDPFMDGNPAKPWHAPTVKHPVDKYVEVECHVLPHKDRLTEVDFNKYQGPDGWTAQQGFYVYRGGRMLVSGDWLGLGRGRLWTKDEAHKLARIRLDIPVHGDSEWKIDIKKATARPPVRLRTWLIEMAEITRHRARKVFAHRGRIAPRTLKGNPLISAWNVDKNSKGIQYKINLEHQAIRAVIDGAGDLLPAVKAMLQVVQETVPVQRIWLDTEEQKETPQNRFSNHLPENLKEVLLDLFQAMTKYQGYSKESAIDILKQTDPFQEYEEMVDSLLDESNGVD